MRRSRVSKETTKIFFDTPSPDQVRRSTRQAAKTISAFALKHHGSSVSVKREENGEDGEDGEDSSSMESADESNFNTDIEDSLTIPRSLRKRKRSSDSPATTVVSTTTTAAAASSPISKTRASPRKRPKPDTNDTDHCISQSPPSNLLPHHPARKTTHPDGSITVLPPSNWESLYTHLKAFRLSSPTAPVDTMGCERLFWPTSPPQEQRYHILTSLMLSSQTKDTVTAAAMHRLHTELVPPHPNPPTAAQTSTSTSTSTLTISNLLSSTPQHLDSLISKVGFHNTKTRHLLLTASMLQRQHGSDVPSSLPALLALPGVGPKMAYLTLSAAWGITEGIGVDVHVHRITNLWGWHTTHTPEETRKILEAWLPRGRWGEINALVVGLGQTVCGSGPPGRRRCGHCGLGGTGLCRGEVKGAAGRGQVKGKKKGGKKEEGGLEGLEVKVEEEAVVNVKENEVKVKVKVEKEEEFVESQGGGRAGQNQRGREVRGAD